LNLDFAGSTVAGSLSFDHTYAEAQSDAVTLAKSVKRSGVVYRLLNVVVYWVPSPTAAERSTIYKCVQLVAKPQTTAPAPAPAPAPAQPTLSTYLTTGAMEQSLEQTGLTVNGVHHATLYAACTGQGVPGPNKQDPKVGDQEPSYKQFLCLTQLSGSNINLIHIQMQSGTRFTWTVVG
jgi:hypothetical protein